MHNTEVVVLCGGVGSRLWPVSSPTRPKLFMELPNGKTLLNQTLHRAAKLASKPLLVSTQALYSQIAAEVDSSGVACCYLLEASASGTASAIAYSAFYAVAKHGPEAVVVVLPADHFICNEIKFESCITRAVGLAHNGYLVTLGIPPAIPEAGFGYIECGEALDSGNKAIRFIEKPNQDTAQLFVDSENFFWNSGVFCFKASVYLNELKLHAPDIAAATANAWMKLAPLKNYELTVVPNESVPDFANVSIDYAVMEKSDKVAVVPADFGWCDIGSWASFKNLAKSDQHANGSVGDALFLDTKNTFVYSRERLVTTLGVEDLVIVDTPSALLVSHLEKSQDVKKLVACLPQRGHNALQSSRTVTRPWGSYTVIERGPGFKIKKIEVQPGGSLSLQMHHHRSEHWVVVSGSARITSGASELSLSANQSTYIPAGVKHRLKNPGTEPCVMIEVQCGEYLEEDDIVRFEDTYGRK